MIMWWVCKRYIYIYIYEILILKVLCVLTPGISVEERSVEEKLDRTLVHPETQHFNILHQRGPQRSQGQHSARWKLLCRGRCGCLWLACVLLLEIIIIFYIGVVSVPPPMNAYETLKKELFRIISWLLTLWSVGYVSPLWPLIHNSK